MCTALGQVLTASGQVRTASGQVLTPPPRAIFDIVIVAVALGIVFRVVLSLSVFHDAPEQLEQSVTARFDSQTLRLESCAGAPGPRAPSRRAWAMHTSEAGARAQAGGRSGWLRGAPCGDGR